MKRRDQSPEAKQERKLQRKANYAALSSQGYNWLGGTMFMFESGVLPKVAAVGMAVKSAVDYNRAIGGEPLIKGDRRERAKQRFADFRAAWANTEGDSLSARMKRSVGQDLEQFQDNEFKTRFNRMMGGLAFAGAGTELILNATNGLQTATGVAMAAGGVAEHLYNGSKGIDRGIELQNETRAAPHIVEQV